MTGRLTPTEWCDHLVSVRRESRKTLKLVRKSILMVDCQANTALATGQKREWSLWNFIGQMLVDRSMTLESVIATHRVRRKKR